MTVKTMEPVGGGGVDVGASEIQDSQRCAAGLELVGEGEHVDRRAAEALEGGDDERVALVERGQGEVELRPTCSSARDAVVDVEVVAPDVGTEEVVDLAVGRLVAAAC